MSRSEVLLKKFKEFVTTANVTKHHDRISLGPLSLNIAIGDPEGFKSGRLIQIFGKEGSGKSTLSLDIIAQYQKQYDHPVLYVDFERSFDEIYAAACGINTEDLLKATPDTLERGFDIIYSCIENGVKLIVIDSIAAGLPKSEEEKDAADNTKMASSAGPITRFVNKVIPMLDDNDVLLVVINQLRANFNTMSPEKEIPFGGMALQYHSSLKLHVTKLKTEVDKQTTQVIVKKSKTDRPQGRADFYIKYGAGIDHAADIIRLAEEKELVVRRGAWYNFGDLKAQGIDGACATFPIEELREIVLNGSN